MSELKNLSAILEGGAVPAGYNGKAIGKLSKTYLKLENRKVVNLYPIGTVMHEDSRYCLYACPLKGTEIDEATLQSITVDGDKVTYPVIVKGNVEMRSFTLSEISSSNYNYDNGILTITLANGSTAKFDVDFFDGLPQLKEFAALLKK